MEIIESTLGIKMKDPKLLASLQDFCAANGQELPPFRLDAIRTDRDVVRSWAKLLELVRQKKRGDLETVVQTCLRLTSTRKIREMFRIMSESGLGEIRLPQSPGERPVLERG